MNVFEAVRTLLAVREYRSESVSASDMRLILDAGHLSASSMNRQPWHFIVIDDRKTLTRLGELARSGPYTAGAAFAVVVAIERKSIFAESDASRAIQSMMLTAWELGIGSNWVGFHGLDEIGRLLGVPETYSVFSMIPFGYPTHAVGKGDKKRKPFDAVVSYGTFGTPMAS